MYSYDDYCHDLNVYKLSYLENTIGLCCDENFINEKEFYRIYQNNKKKKLRLKKWLNKSFNEYKVMYFITLTFSDDYLPRDIDSALSMIKLFLKGINNIDYRFNIDFGDDRGRVHFHGVCNTDITSQWTYGYANCKPINLTSKSVSRVASYVNKVVNHAFKVSTKNNRVITPNNSKLKKEKEEREKNLI